MRNNDVMAVLLFNFGALSALLRGLAEDYSPGPRGAKPAAGNTSGVIILMSVRFVDLGEIWV